MIEQLINILVNFAKGAKPTLYIVTILGLVMFYKFITFDWSNYWNY